MALRSVKHGKKDDKNPFLHDFYIRRFEKQLGEVEAKIGAVAQKVQNIEQQNKAIAKILSGILSALRGDNEKIVVDRDITSPYIPRP